MPTTTTPSGIEIYYETVGSPTDPPVLLVMGYGSQLIAWPRAFSEALAAGGRFVVEFDNRDSGLSSKLDDLEVDMGALVAAAEAAEAERVLEIAAYTLSDLANDCVAILDQLGIDRAHVLGVSMGAMIAQQMAIDHPERLLTLTSMSSTTGEPEYGASTPEAIEALLKPSPSESVRRPSLSVRLPRRRSSKLHSPPSRRRHATHASLHERPKRAVKSPRRRWVMR